MPEVATPPEAEHARTVLADYRMSIRGPGHQRLASAIEQGITRASDLCDIHPPVCKANLGVPRGSMPQFSTPTVREAFVEMLREHGIRVTNAKRRVGQLKASQEEIQVKRVMEILAKHMAGKYPGIRNSVLISRDDYIVDGHHRWAALLMSDPGETMNVIRVNMPIKTLLTMANEFPGVEHRPFDAEGVEPSRWQTLAEALDRSCSGDAFRKNVRREYKAGKRAKGTQHVAIALSVLRKACGLPPDFRGSPKETVAAASEGALREYAGLMGTPDPQRAPYFAPMAGYRIIPTDPMASTRHLRRPSGREQGFVLADGPDGSRATARRYEPARDAARRVAGGAAVVTKTREKVATEAARPLSGLFEIITLEPRMGAPFQGYPSIPVGSPRGIGVSPSAAPADREAGRHQVTLGRDGLLRKRKPGSKPMRAGYGRLAIPGLR